jgi:hypothetical protein
MALEKIIAIDKIEILEGGQIQVRQVTRIMEDGREIGHAYQRHVLAPGDVLDKEDPRTSAVAKVVWTKEVVDKYKAGIKSAGPISAGKPEK